MIELLTVIAIIAILASLLLPALTQAKAAGQSDRCKSNLRQWGVALELFAEDYDAYPHRQGFADSLESAVYPKPWLLPVEWRAWFYVLGDFYMNHRPRGSSYGSVYFCPVTKLTGDALYPLHYGYNSAGCGQTTANVHFGLGGQDQWQGKGSLTPASLLRNPADLYGIGDAFYGARFGIGILSFDLSPVLRTNAWTSFMQDVNFRRSHSGKANVVFCDGHVESLAVLRIFAAPTDTDRRRWNRDGEPHADHWR